MVRLRYTYPPTAPPPPATPRIPVGTRVADPLEGRTGHIESFDGVKVTYRLVFNDGFRTDVGDADVDRFVIRSAAPPEAQPQPQPPVPASSTPRLVHQEEDPERLLGETMEKTVTSYDGQEMVLTGQVSSYFATTRRYRIIFETGLTEDLSVEDTLAGITAMTTSATNAATGSEEPPQKKHKSKRVSADDDGQGAPPPTPLTGQPFQSRGAAYATLRTVLRAILAQDSVKKYCSEKQVSVLANEDVRARRALEMFVHADGLRLLQRVLVSWMRSTETHAGALLVLKLLAGLPGVTAEAVVVSHIGRTLRGISRVSRDLDHVDPTLGELADWVIATWRRDVIPLATTPSARGNVAQDDSETRGTVQPRLYVAPAAMDKHQRARQQTTAHLRDLLTGKVDPINEIALRDESLTKKTPSRTEQVPFFAEYNSLGSIDKRRPVRQVIHIESFVERVTNKARGNEQDEEGMRAIPEGKMCFRDTPSVMTFTSTDAPAELFATKRSKLLAAAQKKKEDARQDVVELVDDDKDQRSGELTRPPAARTLAPKKSILKATADVVISTREIIWD